MFFFTNKYNMKLYVVILILQNLKTPQNCLKSDGLYRERIRGMPTQRTIGEVGYDRRGGGEERTTHLNNLGDTHSHTNARSHLHTHHTSQEIEVGDE